MPGVDQPHLQPPALQNLKNRDPVNARGLHGHRGHATRQQPIGHDVQLVGEAGKLPHRLLAAALGHRDEMASAANVNAGRMRVDVLQVFGQLHLLGSGGLTCAHCSGLRKKNRQDRTGSCRIRLSSKRDSRCFTSDKNASSRTTLINGPKAPMAIRPPRSGCRLKSSRFVETNQVTF